MEITNEDKILLLEKLGINKPKTYISTNSSPLSEERCREICETKGWEYINHEIIHGDRDEHSRTVYTTITYTESINDRTRDFNPLDMSILTKLMDIVEKTNMTPTSINFHPWSYPKPIYSCVIHFFEENRNEIHEFGETREKCILMALLKYFKQNKDGNN
jgi:hypothetical protein